MNVTSVQTASTLSRVNSSRGQSNAAPRQDDNKGILARNQDKTDFNFVGSILPTGNNYSAEDALQNQWNKENSFNLFDNSTFGKIKLGNSRPDSDFVDKLEKNGIGNDVDWFKIGFDFKSLTSDELKINVDYMASRYAVLKEHITANFTGDEQLSELKKLEQAVGTAKETMAREFAEKVGGFLETNGVSGEKEKVFSSIIADFNEKAKGYSNYIKNNEDYANIKGTKNEWLIKDDAFMASTLRQAVNSSENKQAINEKQLQYYSMDDLTSIGKIVNEVQDYNRYAVNTSDSEETIGYKLGVLALKVDTFSKNSGIGENLSDKLKKATDGFVKNHIESINKKLAEQERILTSDEKGFSPLKVEDALAVYNKIISSYEKSGDASKALKEGAVFGKAQYDSKMKSGNYVDVYRYEKNGAGFWNNFNEVKTLGAYEKPTSERISNTWNSFMRQFNNGTNLSLQLGGHDFSKYA